MRRLNHGVDALALAFRIDVGDVLLARLDRECSSGTRPGTFSARGQQFELTKCGRGYRLANADCALIVSADRNGFGIVCEARALLLRTRPLGEVISLLSLLANGLCHRKPKEVRVRRLDLFMDVCGVVFDSADTENFVSRARRQVEFHAPEQSHFRKRDQLIQTTGFTFAPGNAIMVRLYDKLTELLQVQGSNSEKTRTEFAKYREAGWSGEPVWRLEAQLRGEALASFKAREAATLEKAIPGIWAYLFAGERPWLRLVVRGSASRRERSVSDPRWALFGENPFVAYAAPAARIEGNGGGAMEQHVLGAVHSLLGSHGLLAPTKSSLSAAEMMELDLGAVARLLRAHVTKDPDHHLRLRESARARFERLHLEVAS